VPTSHVDAYDQRGPALNALSVVNNKALDEAGAMLNARRERCEAYCTEFRLL
jgi:hypothetical protein